MEDYLFAYGTLRLGLAPPDVQPLIQPMQPVGAGWTPGRLYNLGAYPGAVFDPADQTRIQGDVYRLPGDAGALLERLDAYEGYLPANPERSLFVRVRIQSMLSDGRRLDCWAYRYNRNPAQAPLVPGGDYAKLRA